MLSLYMIGAAEIRGVRGFRFIHIHNLLLIMGTEISINIIITIILFCK